MRVSNSTGASITMERSAGAREQREQEFWDREAEKTSSREVVCSARRLDLWDKRKLQLYGDLAGKQALDVGCGFGRWSVILADHGARVCAFDISPESVALCRAAADLSGHSDTVAATVMSLHHLSYDDATFDVVHGQDILHHVDVATAGEQLRRVMKPGGRAIFRENSSRNRVLMLARDYLCGRFGIPKWSSDDEYPLSPSEIRRFARSFGGSYTIEYPEFLFFHYFDAKFFGYRVRLISRICHGLDRAVYHWLPWLRRYSYHQLIILDKPQ